MSKVIVVPVRVQGAEAPEEICQALDLVNALEAADLIITGRGGGSMEDLWAFNEEEVARAISRSHIPVISAVGHEPDVTIADFVADLRAATPSNGAELAVPDQNELYAWLDGLAKRLVHTRCEKAVVGISGGLDSTLALLVAVRTFDKLQLDRTGIIGITMPGFGTTDRTYNNALELMRGLGVTIREIPIRDACLLGALILSLIHI